jgi:hypothetical protein
MRILPKTPAQQVVRLTTLVPAWAEHPEALGLSPERVAELEALLAQARAAQLAAYKARSAAQSATLAFEHATAALVDNASAAISLIKATATISGDPISVLSLAQLPAPKPRGRIAPPGTPKNFSVALRPTGSLLIKWACDNPRGSVGTVYEVRRRIGDHGDFERLAMRGKKTFTDTTIPAPLPPLPGTASITYEITAIRSTGRGTPGRYVVYFGSAAASQRKHAA